MLFWGIILLTEIYGKHIKKSLKLPDDNRWEYLTKFGMNVGEGEWSFRAKLINARKLNKFNYTFSLVTYIDDSWQPSELFELNCGNRTERANYISEITIPGNGTWGEVYRGTLSQNINPSVWYFALSDCRKRLSKLVRVKTDFVLLNSDGSHLSVEEQSMPTIYLAIFGIFVLLLLINIYKLIRMWMRQDQVLIPLLMVATAVFFEALSLLLKYISLTMYAEDGSGIFALEFISQMFCLLSQLIVVFLLILIADGWTINYENFPSIDVYFPVLGILSVIHVAVLAIGKVTDDSHYKFSEYESVSGAVIILLRLGMFVWFMINVRRLFKTAVNTKGDFLYKFTIVSSGYLLSLPILVIGSLSFAPHLRLKVIVTGSALAQCVAMLALTWIFTSKGQFYKVSTFSATVLPGGKALD